MGTVRLGPEVRGGSGDFFRQACALGLEGAVCKKADSVYAAGTRSRDWVKVKCVRRQEMVIGGYTDPQGSRTGFGALLLGVYDDGKLRYAGKVGTGFDEATLRKLAPELKKRERKDPPFVNPPRGFEAKRAHWMRPDLVAEVAFTEWSADGALRHPSFLGLRLDKKATEVVRERAAKPSGNDERHAAGATPRRSAAKHTSATRTDRKPTAGKPTAGKPATRAAEKPDLVAGVALSHPEKAYFPEATITKRDLAEYYARRRAASAAARGETTA